MAASDQLDQIRLQNAGHRRPARQYARMAHYFGRTKPAPVDERPARAIELRQARIDAGLTQHDLARLSGTLQSTIAKCESGAIPVTDQRLADLLRAIAQAKP